MYKIYENEKMSECINCFFFGCLHLPGNPCRCCSSLALGDNNYFSPSQDES